MIIPRTPSGKAPKKSTEVKKGVAVRSPYAGQDLKGGGIAPAYGEIKSISKGWVYIDFGIGSMYTPIRVTELQLQVASDGYLYL